MTSTARRAALVVLCVLAITFASTGLTNAQSREGDIMVVRLDAEIDRKSERMLIRWLADAERQDAALLVLELDTPGGLGDSMRNMSGAILESPVPVAVIVTPSGARAASAGTFIVAAGHVSAMTPGTTIGAASPVNWDGGDLPQTMKAKASQDAAALLRGIAHQRNRGEAAVSALEKTVFHAEAYSAEEAVKLGMIDFTASGVPDLLAKIDGRVVNVRGAKVTLNTVQTATDATAGLSDGTPTPAPPSRGWLDDPRIVWFGLGLMAVGAALFYYCVSAANSPNPTTSKPRTHERRDYPASRQEPVDGRRGQAAAVESRPVRGGSHYRRVVPAAGAPRARQVRRDPHGADRARPGSGPGPTRDSRRRRRYHA